MKKLQFKTNSRHISQLGRELVTDFVTALRLFLSLLCK